MIFVTVGTQKFQFNRLLIQIDKLIDSGIIKKGEIYAQIGHSDYMPINFQYKRFMDHNAFSEKIANSSLVISHAGTGALTKALRASKKVIAVPRLKKYKEHVDNHQLEIAELFGSKNYVLTCLDIGDLSIIISAIKLFNPAVYVSDNSKIIACVMNFIERNYNLD